MDEQEICCFIREARDPLTRITICAQMNLCKPQELAKGKKKKDVARQFGMTVYGLSYVIKRYIPERRKKKAPDVGAPGAAVETA